MLAHNLPVVAVHAELEKLKKIQHNFFAASFPQKKHTLMDVKARNTVGIMHLQCHDLGLFVNLQLQCKE